MTKNYILSSWKGFEVDSSEFYAALEIEDVPRTIRVFLESPYIQEDFRCSNLFIALIKAVEFAKLEDEEKLGSIKIKEQSFDQIIQKHLISILNLLKESKSSSPKKLRISNRKSSYYINQKYTKIPDKLIEANELYNLLRKMDKKRSMKKTDNESYFKALERYESSWIEKEDLLEIAIYIKFLLQDFPHLSFLFNTSTVTFDRKADDPEGSNSYKFSLSGSPIPYSVPWYTSAEWHAVLKSIKAKTTIRDYYPPH